MLAYRKQDFMEILLRHRPPLLFKNFKDSSKTPSEFSATLSNPEVLFAMATAMSNYGALFVFLFYKSLPYTTITKWAREQSLTRILQIES